MKKRIITLAIFLVAIISSFILGTTQAKTATKTVNVIPENYIDMEQVTNFTATETGLQLYFEDGTGYYWEK